MSKQKKGFVEIEEKNYGSLILSSIMFYIVYWVMKPIIKGEVLDGQIVFLAGVIVCILGVVGINFLFSFFEKPNKKLIEVQYK